MIIRQEVVVWLSYRKPCLKEANGCFGSYCMPLVEVNSQFLFKYHSLSRWEKVMFNLYPSRVYFILHTFVLMLNEIWGRKSLNFFVAHFPFFCFYIMIHQWRPKATAAVEVRLNDTIVQYNEISCLFLRSKRNNI